MPGTGTTMNGMAFYRSKLRAAGEAVPTCKEIKRARIEAMLNLAC